MYLYKVLAVAGESGSGKTSIVEKLKEKYPEQINIIYSWTDRPQRYENEKGHFFVDYRAMTHILEKEEVVAKTVYGNHRYCSTLNLFDISKINVYIVDNQGIQDLRDFFTKIYTILIYRDEKNVSKDRSIRDTPIDLDLVDKILYNNHSLDEAVDELSTYIYEDVLD